MTIDVVALSKNVEVFFLAQGVAVKSMTSTKSFSPDKEYFTGAKRGTRHFWIWALKYSDNNNLEICDSSFSLPVSVSGGFWTSWTTNFTGFRIYTALKIKQTLLFKIFYDINSWKYVPGWGLSGSFSWKGCFPSSCSANLPTGVFSLMISSWDFLDDPSLLLTTTYVESERCKTIQRDKRKTGSKNKEEDILKQRLNWKRGMMFKTC